MWRSLVDDSVKRKRIIDDTKPLNNSIDNTSNQTTNDSQNLFNAISNTSHKA